MDVRDAVLATSIPATAAGAPIRCVRGPVPRAARRCAGATSIGVSSRRSDKSLGLHALRALPRGHWEERAPRLELCIPTARESERLAVFSHLEVLLSEAIAERLRLDLDQVTGQITSAPRRPVGEGLRRSGLLVAVSGGGGKPGFPPPPAG